MKEKNQYTVEPVSLARRFGAMLYDFILLLSILFIISFIIVMIFKITPEHPFFIIYQSFIFIISFFFYSWFWIHGGQTLGMKAWKFKITCVNGSNVNWKIASIRFLTAILSWLPFGLGYVWSIFDKKKRTWHDIASSTRLVRL